MAANPAASSVALMALGSVSTEDDVIWSTIAIHPRTPWVWLAHTSRTFPREARARIGQAMAPSTALGIMMRSQDILQGALELTGESPGVPLVDQTRDALWELLARNQSAVVRERVADSRMVPEQVLNHLVDDREVRVRHALASNAQAPRAVLGRLALDTRRTVRIAVAANPRTPGDVLSWMATDDHVGVDFENRFTETETRFYRRTTVAIHRAVAANPSTPVFALGELPIEHCLKPLAGNVNSPARVLTAITEYLCAAEWPRVVDPMWKELQRDELRGALEGLLKNPSLPEGCQPRLGNEEV